MRKGVEKMTTWVFPGQGSQYKGMGERLWDRYPEHVDRAADILGYSVKRLCMEDPHGLLDRTQYTQPALYVVNALCFFNKLDETGKRPDYLAGHSLGEYSALMASGCLDFETGLKLVKKRSSLMSKAVGGAMVAIINLSSGQVADLLRKYRLDEIDIANFNTPSQIVLSGPAEQMDKTVEIFKSAGASCLLLRVSGAFHSRYMRPIRDEFETFLKGIVFDDMAIPVISNVDARPYRKDRIGENLAKQLTNCVQWTESIRRLLSFGQRDFEEIGPGRVLTNLIGRIRKEADVSEGEVNPVFAEPESVKLAASSPGSSETKLRNLPTTGSRAEVVKKISWDDRNRSSYGFSASNSETLGCQAFREDYGLENAYVSGAMFRGVASKEMVVRMGRAGMMGSLGTGGMEPGQIEKDIRWIQSRLNNGQSYMMNLLSNVGEPEQEERLVDLYLECGVQIVEASAFMQITPSLVRYRLTGLKPGPAGKIIREHKIIAKISRPEVAEAFLSPPPPPLVSKLLLAKRINKEQAKLAESVPMADDLVVEADSGGHTDRGNLAILLPAMLRLRDRSTVKFGYHKKVRVGAAGGIGTPEAAAAAFILGADFILTGSINQCTVEAGTSDAVKDILQTIRVQDTDYAPAADMFEYGAKVQVVRKGLFFPARASKLFELYRRYGSLEEIDAKTRQQIEKRYFQRTFEDVYESTKAYFMERNPSEIERAERNSKHKMALVFRWYLFNSIQMALQGTEDRKVDYQIHCGPALGAFNDWVRGTTLENWRNRHVDAIGEMLMRETAMLLNDRLETFIGARDAVRPKFAFQQDHLARKHDQDDLVRRHHLPNGKKTVTNGWQDDKQLNI